MLPKWGRFHKDGYYHFKMSEMSNAGQMENVGAFYRVIEQHVILGLSCSFRMKDLERAKARIHIPSTKIDWGFLDNNFLVAFRMLMDMFHENRDGDLSRVIPSSAPIDFYFDMQGEKKKVVQAWDSYVSNRPHNIQPMYGREPMFRHDHEFLPLQAADFYAWWIRRWTADPNYVGNIDKLNFGNWTADPKKYPRAHIAHDEDQLTASITRILEAHYPGTRVIDLKNF